MWSEPKKKKKVCNFELIRTKSIPTPDILPVDVKKQVIVFYQTFNLYQEVAYKYETLLLSIYGIQ